MAYEPDRKNLERQNLENRRAVYADRGGMGWWWVLWLIIIAAIIWGIGWGWGGWWGARRTTAIGPAGNNAPVATANQPAVPQGDVALIRENNKESYIGQHVKLENVSVQKVRNAKIFWVGTSDQHKLLVVNTASALPQSEGTEAAKGGNAGEPTHRNSGATSGNSELQSGKIISVSGTVEKAPDASQAQSELGLNQDEAKDLAKAGAYLRADTVSLGSTGTQAGQTGPAPR